MTTKPTYKELENRIKELEKFKNSQSKTNFSKLKNTEESKSDCKLLFENMTEAFALHRIVQDEQNKVINYVFIEINKEFELQTGLKKSKILNKKVTEVLPKIEKDPANWIDTYGKVALSGVPLKFEQFSKPLQKWYSVLVYSPKEKYFATIFRDITDQKNTELELKKQSLFVNTLLDNLNIGVVACDAKGKLTYFNKTTQKFHGLPHENINSEHWAAYYDLYLPDGKTKMQMEDIPLFKALEGEQFNNIEMMIIPKQGKSYTLAASGSTIFDADGKKQGAVVSMYDISERIKAKQTLKESEIRYKTIFNNNYSVMLLIDPENGQIVDANDAACDYYGYSFEKITQMKINQINTLSKKEVYEAMQKAKNNNRNIFFFKHQLSNNDIRDVEVYSCKILFSSKIYLFSIINDITDRIKTQKILKESEQKLRKNNKTKDKFFSIIAHDLKNPFNSIIGFSNILLKNHKKYNAKKRENLIKLVNDSAVNTFKLLENLLTWSQSQSGRIEYSPEKLHLKILLFETTSALQWQADKKDIHVSDETSENELIYADKNMIATILRNIISNAIKFTNNSGSVIISSKKQLNNNFIEVSVKDTGIGIPKDKIDDLFDIATNTSTKGTEAESGTGLGLILCKEFIEKHDGKIWLESELGFGSNFIFTLPLSK